MLTKLKQFTKQLLSNTLQTIKFKLEAFVFDEWNGR